jgi:hypothetical protein
MARPTNLDWKQYEAITKYIYESLGRQSGVKVKGYGKDCKVIGKSGVAHQIDVLTAHSDGVHEYQTAIECKYWNQKINKDIVMKVAAVVEDANISKGVIVSKSGFTPDAIDFARFRNIGLVELREAEEKDLEGQPPTMDLAILTLRINAIIRRPVVSRIEIDSVENTAIEKEYWINTYFLKLTNGRQVPFANYLKDFQDELHRQKKEWEAVSKQYEVPGALLINSKTKASETINLIILTGVLERIDKSSTQELTLVDRVWLIMKSLFENSTFVFFEGGIIMKK